MYSYGTATKWVKQSIHVICVKELVNSLVSNCESPVTIKEYRDKGAYFESKTDEVEVMCHFCVQK